MNRKAFYDALRPKLGALTTSNVVGFEGILTEAQRRRSGLHDLAHILATGWWESGKTMAPVEEGFYLGSKAKAFQRRLRYYPFYGRGLVQLTHEANYRKASELVGEDLVKNPERALDPAISIKVLFDGMERGWFTGKKLADYIDNIDEPDAEDLREYANARRVVNGTDRQIEIGKLSLTFEAALKAGGYSATPAPVPVPPPPMSPDVEPAPPEPPVAVSKVTPLGVGAALAALAAAVGAYFWEWF